MLTHSFDEHASVLTASRAVLLEALEQVVDATVACFARGGKVIAFGNGGSAAHADHLVAELVGRFHSDRPGWLALSLSSSPATITAIANDFGYDAVFARQVRACARPGDLVVALSTSGMSTNVLAGLRAARTIGCTLVGFTGAGGGRLDELCDLVVPVASSSSARIQELHTLCIHSWVAELELRAKPDGADGVDAASSAVPGCDRA